MNTPENNLITVFVSKELTALYKSFLETLEDLKKDHTEMMGKVAQTAGESFATNVDYFSTQKYEQLRKRVLDKGNDHLRSLSTFLDFFDFIINKEKVEDAARQKRQTITKKVIISGVTSLE